MTSYGGIQVSAPERRLTEARMQVALLRTMAMAMRCLNQAVSRGSPDARRSLEPSSFIAMEVVSPQAPVVSNEIGSKR